MELAQLIAESGADWIDWPVERAIFGTTEPAAITAEIERFVREELGDWISEPLFFESSVGSVFGLRLGDGREVVVKAHQPDEPRDYLIAVQAVCRHLSTRGFPCPRPVQRVVGHVDWSVKHFRFRDGNVTGVYDWDSLALDREPVIVGEAARGFTFTWRIPVRLAPLAR